MAARYSHGIYKRSLGLEAVHGTLCDLVQEVVKWNTENKSLKNLREVSWAKMAEERIATAETGVDLQNSYNTHCRYLQDHEARERKAFYQNRRKRTLERHPKSCSLLQTGHWERLLRWAQRGSVLG